MAIFFNDPKLLTELQVNGQEVGDSADNATNNTDYTNDGEDTQAADNPAEAPEEYTVPDEGEEQTPEEADANPPEEGTETGEEDPNQSTDYTDDAGATEGGDEGAPAEGGDTPQEEGEDDYSDEGGDDYADDTPSDDEVKQLEDELFSKFNDQQIGIMNTNLKQSYIDLYEMLDTTIERINEIPKEDRYLRIIGFISDKLSEVKDMINDYLVRTYNTKSFVENQINYKRFCITIRQIDSIIDQIYPKKD